MPLSKIQGIDGQVTPNLGRRNMIINGAMSVAQRGTSGSNGAATSTLGYLSLDRMGYWADTSSTFTMSQETDAPAGFTNSLKVNIDATRSGAGIYYSVGQRIEANACSQLDLGESTAKTFTTSFYVKSSVTGNFNIFFFNSGYNTCYTTTYTINAANTWEYKTVTIPGPTVGTWATGTGYGLEVGFKLGHGTNWQATNPNQWQTAENFRIGSAGTVNLTDTLNATWQITGLQLEVGSTATDFEHRSYAEELRACKRYYEEYNNDNSYYFAQGAYTSSTTSLYQMSWEVEKRATPSVTISAGSTFILTRPGTSNASGGTMASGNRSRKNMYIQSSSNPSSSTTGRGTSIATYTNSYVKIDSEL